MKRYLAAILLIIIAYKGAPVIASDARDSASPYGVLDFPQWDHDWNGYFYNSPEKLERAATLMEKAGVRWLRMDFLWADLEPEQGKFEFDRYDRLIDTFQKHQIHILGILEYNPVWRNVAWNSAPDEKAYVNFAVNVVHHFKDRIKYWEVWNEPDQKTYWEPQDDLKAYSNLLRATYPAVKKEDPTAVVLAGAASDYIATALRSLYRQAGRNSFDIVNIHPFIDHPAASNAAASLEKIHHDVRTVMEEFGDGEKDIWFTEIGSPGVVAGHEAGNWWGGDPPDEEQQAKWLEIVYGNALKWKGVKKVFWAFFRDTDHFFGNAVDTFGMVHVDFSPKPAYFTYQRVATGAREEN